MDRTLVFLKVSLCRHGAKPTHTWWSNVILTNELAMVACGQVTLQQVPHQHQQLHTYTQPTHPPTASTPPPPPPALGLTPCHNYINAFISLFASSWHLSQLQLVQLVCAFLPADSLLSICRILPPPPPKRARQHDLANGQFWQVGSNVQSGQTSGKTFPVR